MIIAALAAISVHMQSTWHVQTLWHDDRGQYVSWAINCAANIGDSEAAADTLLPKGAVIDHQFVEAFLGWKPPPHCHTVNNQKTGERSPQ